MDNIYHSIKEFVKSIGNLFVAIIGLFAGIINGLAFLLEKLRPRVSERLDGITQNKEDTAKHRIFGNGRLQEASGNDEEFVKEIRSKLQEKVTSRERYYYYIAQTENNGNGFYAVMLMIFTLALVLAAMLYQSGRSTEMWFWAAMVMAAACVAVCILVVKHQRRVKRNHIARLILENEFSDIEWGKIHPISLQPSGNAGNPYSNSSCLPR